jgi:hypothetical protein
MRIRRWRRRKNMSPVIQNQVGNATRHLIFGKASGYLSSVSVLLNVLLVREFLLTLVKAALLSWCLFTQMLRVLILMLLDTT